MDHITPCRRASDRPTIPAPAPVSEAVRAYLAASERVAAALREQAVAVAALRALDSRHPQVSL
jgi:hypothetical protein